MVSERKLTFDRTLAIEWTEAAQTASIRYLRIKIFNVVWNMDCPRVRTIIGDDRWSADDDRPCSSLTMPLDMMNEMIALSS